jgi:hypothetical protein
MTPYAPFTCLGVTMRLLAVWILCVILFFLDRIVPPLFGFQYSRLQDATFYVWLVVLPFVGFIWVLCRSRWLSSRSWMWRWFISVAGALLLTVVFALLTLYLIWISG